MDFVIEGEVVPMRSSSRLFVEQAPWLGLIRWWRLPMRSQKRLSVLVGWLPWPS